ncbi:MAG: amidohydrolase family protein [Phycisphaerales bacterium]|nr:amidohydrolase family protein [Phycisphaerales bacterium]
MSRFGHTRLSVALITVLVCAAPTFAQVAIKADTIYTMAGEPIRDGVVVIVDGEIRSVGPAASTQIPQGMRVMNAKVATPGLIDARATVGLTGITNQEQDQDQLDRSSPIQPELRAIDAVNMLDPLVEYLRNYGITTAHVGHAPGELISGQTMVIKLVGTTVDSAILKPQFAVSCTLAEEAQKGDDKSPGTRPKMVAMLRAELIKAQEYLKRMEAEKPEDRPARDLRLETLGKVLRGEMPLMVYAHRVRDISNALRLADEFKFKLWLDGACESYLIADRIKAAGVPVIVHPTMTRAWGDTQNLTLECAAKLRDAGVPIALQSGFEDYVPKTRVVLFEAAIGAAHGLGFEDALRSITIDAARLLGVDDRVGSLEVGKDGDVALYDGDPFEYTTHCVGVVIGGEVVSDTPH